MMGQSMNQFYILSSILRPIIPTFQHSVNRASWNPFNNISYAHRTFGNARLEFSATDYVNNQPETENSRNYVTDDSQGRKAKK